MVRIRLKKTGAKNWISFRIVACDIRKQRDGKMLEELGYYDPRKSDEKMQPLDQRLSAARSTSVDDFFSTCKLLDQRLSAA